MEKEIKMEKKNSEGKIIVKNIPQSLSPFYKNIGWEFSKETKKAEESRPLTNERNK